MVNENKSSRKSEVIRCLPPQLSADAKRMMRNGRPVNMCRWIPGIASEFIIHFEELISKQPVREVVLYCRESYPNGNLEDQRNETKEIIEGYSVKIARIYSEVCRGIVFEPEYDSEKRRVEFELAIQRSRSLQIPLVAYSSDRFIRSRSGADRGKSPPRVYEYLELSRETRGVILTTIKHPDDQSHGDHIRRGKRRKHRNGGRPRGSKKTGGKRRREEYLEIVKKLHEKGYSHRKIRDTLNAIEDDFANVCHATVRNWLRSNRPK